MKTYLAYVYKDPFSSFGVSFPDVPGCYGAGETYDEAVESAKISLREYARAMGDDGEDMPEPRTHGDLAADATECIELDKAAFVIEVPLVVIGAKRRVNLSIDARLLDAIDRACELAGANRSAFLARVASEWLQDSMGAVVVTKAKGPKARKRKRALAVATT